MIRGQKAMLDRDLADLYGVKTKALKQAVRGDMKRFPEDFMFELSKDEFRHWRSQFVISKGRGGRRDSLPDGWSKCKRFSGEPINVYEVLDLLEIRVPGDDARIFSLGRCSGKGIGISDRILSFDFSSRHDQIIGAGVNFYGEEF